MKKQIEKQIHQLEKLLDDSNLQATIELVISTLTISLTQNLPLLVFGNGGSAADAMHIAGELVGKFKKNRRPLNVICLNTNSVITSAWSNDFDYESVFARQVQAHGIAGGICWGISTSGNSKSVLLGLEEAQKIGMITIGMTGNGAGSINKYSNLLIAVPSDETPRIQELHLPIYHYICEEIEKNISAIEEN
jgi:D-sedoheptulose 7-phosphate isomerase